MIKALKQLLIVYSILLSFKSYTQINIEVYTNLGVSHLSTISLDPNLEAYQFIFDYNYASSFSLGGALYKPILNDMFCVKAGLELNSNAVIVNNKEGGVIEGVFEKYEGRKVRFYNIAIPFQINYAFEKYLYFNIGLSNNFHLINNNEISFGDNIFKTIEKMRFYSLGYIVGFDFIIKESYSLGLNYQRDITASFKNPSYDLYHYFDQINLRIAYSIK